MPERLGSYPYNDSVGIHGMSPKSLLATSAGIDDQPICVNIAVASRVFSSARLGGRDTVHSPSTR